MDLEFSQRTADFVDWLSQGGRQQAGTWIGPENMHETQLDEITVSQKISIVDKRQDGRGRAVVALNDIAENEQMFQIAHDDIMCVRNSNLRRHLHGKLKDLPPWLSLVLVMIFEDGRGQESKWYPYWRVLPSEFDTLIYWSDQELKELQGSAVVHKIGKQDAEEAFEVLLLPIVVEHATLFGKYAPDFEGADAKTKLFSVAHRMATLVMAYAFDLDQDDESSGDGHEDDLMPDEEENQPKGMVPYADMINANGDKNNARLFHGDSGVSMVAIKPIKEGDEIFNDYGSLPRSDLLRRYGYITDEYKKYDVVEIDSMKLAEAAQEIQRFSAEEIETKVKLAEALEIWDDAFDLQRNILEEGFDPALLQCVAILTSDKADFNAMRALKKETAPILDSKRAQVLRTVLRKRQNDYGTSIAEDVQQLKDGCIKKRQRMAVEVRLGEKQVLAEALLYLDQALASITDPVDPAFEPHKAKKRKI